MEKNEKNYRPVAAVSFEKFRESKSYEDESFDEIDTDFFESPKVIMWDTLSEMEIKNHSWRIENVVPQEGFMILASISGEKKTWIGMEMAKSISHGINFLGEDKFKTEGCNVLYLNCENSEREMQRRGKQLGFKSDSQHSLYFLNTPDGINLNDERVVRWLLEFIEYYEVGVVFVDTFRAVAGGLKEEKAEEIRQFFAKFGPLKNKGVAMVWLDHFRKPSNLDGKVPKKEHLLGSQDKAASVETLLMIKSEGGSEIIECYQRKNRLAPELKPFQIVMADHLEDGKLSTLLTYGGEIDDDETKKDEAKDVIITILEKGGKSTPELLEITKKEAGIGGRNTRDALRELVDNKIIEISKRSGDRANFYSLSPEGEASPEEPISIKADELF